MYSWLKYGNRHQIRVCRDCSQICNIHTRQKHCYIALLYKTATHHPGTLFKSRAERQRNTSAKHAFFFILWYIISNNILVKDQRRFNCTFSDWMEFENLKFKFSKLMVLVFLKLACLLFNITWCCHSLSFRLLKLILFCFTRLIHRYTPCNLQVPLVSHIATCVF